MFLANLASKVTLIHRRNSLRAERVMQARLFSHPKIETVWDSAIEEVLGDDAGVTGVRIRNIQTGAMHGPGGTGAVHRHRP